MTTLTRPLIPATRTRRGFTLVELLVVIAIIGTLTALALAAVQRARGAARRIQCVNNMGQIGKAMINYETAKQSYPGYVNSLERSKQQGQATTAKKFLVLQADGLSTSRFDTATVTTTAKTYDDSRVSWAAMILNQIEEAPVYDIMVDSTIDVVDDRALIRPIAAYMCPDDSELVSVQGNAGISYSANTGAWDWYTPAGALASNFNSTTFKAIPPDGRPNAHTNDNRANGIFHNLTLGRVKMDAGDVSKGDGAESTLMLAENIQKEGSYTWAGVGPNSPGEQQLGVVWLDPTQYGDATNRDWSPFTSGVMQPFSAEGNTPEYSAVTPEYARPSSGHSGVFNAVMASGAVKTIAVAIDYDVYQRLLTVQGRKCVEPVEHRASAFQTLPPLAAGDY
jgi:prepilin-type N-terminal cleavage/methylation domain-containing protein